MTGQLRFKRPLPESGGEQIGFHPEYVWRTPEEVANDVQIQLKELEERELKLKEMRRQDYVRQIEHNSKYGLFGSYTAKSFLAVSAPSFCVGVVLGILAWQMLPF